MEIRSEPSSNVGAPKSPPSSPFPSAQNASMEISDSQASHGFTIIAEDSGIKRKRGRPRRYTPDDETSLQGAGSSSGFTGLPSADRLETKKKRRNKNVRWGKKIQMKALGLSGIGFTPHVITVKTGEDVSTKIMSFSNQGSRAVCVLSANGIISSVALHQAATSGGTVAYEGQFEILSLSGSFSPSESSGQPNRTGGLSVSLAGPDGRVIGGGVAGVLVAATPVQVVVGSFIPKGGGRKEPLQPVIHPAGESEPEKPTQGGFPGPSSPISRGASNPASPHNQSTNGDNHNGNNNKGVRFIQWK
ncbi:AT-hook motif nuclear-localized protein 10-like isoform X1 [Phalaenopsis equestris]|uniref:AT-hook motif nuclear-localized protein 10-like isoform X1 n=1 Tax=Phalaenopsis equestris TaxID=78828 RepID=UPI0009E378D1|nr:AT-hook motif nuclear-localized protein 10-like isoform X1 [Phalaenopsis equestris]